MQVVGLGVWHFVFKIEVNSLSCRHRNSVFALILLNELPEGVCAKLLLETDGHDFVLPDLSPLNSICIVVDVLSLRSN